MPDSAYFRYALQQNMYALLLEQRHGLRCDGGLYLLRLHAELGEGAYEMVQCPDMRAEAMGRWPCWSSSTCGSSPSRRPQPMHA